MRFIRKGSQCGGIFDGRWSKIKDKPFEDGLLTDCRPFND